MTDPTLRIIKYVATTLMNDNSLKALFNDNLVKLYRVKPAEAIDNFIDYDYFSTPTMLMGNDKMPLVHVNFTFNFSSKIDDTIPNQMKEATDIILCSKDRNFPIEQEIDGKTLVINMALRGNSSTNDYVQQGKTVYVLHVQYEISGYIKNDA